MELGYLIDRISKMGNNVERRRIEKWNRKKVLMAIFLVACQLGNVELQKMILEKFHYWKTFAVVDFIKSYRGKLDANLYVHGSAGKEYVYCNAPCISPGLTGILVNDWAVLNSRRAYTRGGLIHGASCKICNVTNNKFYVQKKLYRLQNKTTTRYLKRFHGYHFTISKRFHDYHFTDHHFTIF